MWEFVVPLVNVIIPAYNAEAYLESTVSSVRAQTMTEWRLLIVDDGATDATRAIAQRLALEDDRIECHSFENGGLASARNRGVTAVRQATPYLLFLDADDTLEPTALELLCQLLASNPAYSAVHGLARFIDETGQIWRPKQAETLGRERFAVIGNQLSAVQGDAPTTFAILAYRNCIWTAGQVLVRQTALEACGSFDATLSATSDWDMWLRLSREGPIGTLNTVSLNYRRHDGNMSGIDKLMRWHELLLRRKLLTSEHLTLDEKRVALTGYRLSERYNAAFKYGLVQQCLKDRRRLMAIKYLRHAFMNYIRALPGVPI